MADQKKPIVEFSDPVEDLVKAFNDRAEKVQIGVDNLEKTTKSQIEDIRSSFSRITGAVITVMVIGFITLLFAFGTILVAFWQYSSSTLSASNQDKTISQLTQEISQLKRSQDQAGIILTKLNNNLAK